MNSPLVSIIIPAYNTVDYVAHMLDCVISQTYTKLQIIIINDGSDDGTETIIEKYARLDNRIEVLKLNRSGVSAARNSGLSKAKGEKIFFWDSDDIIELTAVEECLNFAQEKNCQTVLYGYANRTNGVVESKHCSKLREVYQNHEIIDELIPSFIGHSFNDVNEWIEGKRGLREGKEHTALWRVMLDTNVIKDNGLIFDTKLTLGEDTKFMNEYLLYTQSVGYLDKLLYQLTMRQNGANLTSLKNPEKMLDDKIKLIHARKEIDGLALSLYGKDIYPYWQGTLVFSAVQVAMRLSKNKNKKYSQNLKLCKDYMSIPEVKECVKNFKPVKKFKALPFRMLKRFSLLFFMFYIMPKRFLKKFGV
ncbi:MAG: glycosyltransferase family 2 protein [Clostridia bacterium]|nr:glycosyltransferase family 2 protein [Clostridia bacterium]